MKNIFIIVLLFFISGCSMRTFNKPSAPASLKWKKEGYTQRMNEIELSKCGYPIRNYTTKDEYILRKVKMEQCMLNKGFKYSDTYWKELAPNRIYSAPSEVCQEVEKILNYVSPACQSLKNR
ncbi:hypothetical protein [Sulfurovum sp.]|jgi:hypothetical protein|uniref:hypothetical protein n=1 Tax=Sulfurovum sp. TaxID=1969726 RepID=UPI002A363C2E|nr:hypothetical protein [Sulfurovum sp.]